jgi:hypothetical protein
MGIFVELGKSKIYCEIHLPNPIVAASAQGYHEIVKYFDMAEARIRYLESLLSENSVPELAAPTEELNPHGREDSNSTGESV